MILFDFARNRDNNFKLIAFLAALTVLYSHSWPLALGLKARQPITPLTGMTFGSIAVDIFFIISGFFIARSYATRSSNGTFVASRLLRIYPGMIVSTLICVFVVGGSFTILDTGTYLADSETLKFMKRNMLLYDDVRHSLPGVFQDNPYPSAVVGSVWTLPYQLRAYLYFMLAALVLERLLGSIDRGLPRTVYVTIATVIVVMNISDHLFNFTDSPSLRLYAMFSTGSIFYLLREWIPLVPRYAAAALGCLVVSLLIGKGIYYVTYSVAIGYLLMFIAYVPGGRIRRFNRFGDYSFGIYIYGFTVQQSVMALADPGVAGLFAIAAPITLVLAFASWHLVEKHALKLRRRNPESAPARQ